MIRIESGGVSFFPQLVKLEVSNKRLLIAVKTPERLLPSSQLLLLSLLVRSVDDSSHRHASQTFPSIHDVDEAVISPGELSGFESREGGSWRRSGNVLGERGGEGESFEGGFKAGIGEGRYVGARVDRSR